MIPATTAHQMAGLGARRIPGRSSNLASVEGLAAAGPFAGRLAVAREMLAADFVDHFDQRHDILVRRIGQQAVAQVEDVATAISGLFQDALGALADEIVVAV